MKESLKNTNIFINLIPDMDNGLNDGVAVVVYEGERPGLVGDGERELVVVDEADLLDLAGVVHIVQQHGVAQHLCI